MMMEYQAKTTLGNSELNKPHRNAKRSHNFLHLVVVPSFMVRICTEYQADVAKIERTQILDPFMLASLSFGAIYD